jgi:hypothetical protein
MLLIVVGLAGLPVSAWASPASFVSSVAFGAAANINAASPMVVAGIQARNDVEIAQIYSDLAKYQADSAASVARDNMDNAVAVERARSLAAYDIFRIQEAGKNYRFDRVQDELRDARKDALAFQKAGLQQQWRFQDRYLDVLVLQGRLNEQVARLALQHQLSAQGLNTFFAANPLTTTPGGPALAGMGATASPTALTVSTSSGRRPLRLSAPGAMAPRYPGRPHAISRSASPVRPLSTHATH